VSRGVTSLYRIRGPLHCPAELRARGSNCLLNRAGLRQPKVPEKEEGTVRHWVRTAGCDALRVRGFFAGASYLPSARSMKEAGAQAGLSRDQIKTAVRVANVPKADLTRIPCNTYNTSLCPSPRRRPKPPSASAGRKDRCVFAHTAVCSIVVWRSNANPNDAKHVRDIGEMERAGLPRAVAKARGAGKAIRYTTATPSPARPTFATA
jgi:hypothetical protein